MWVEIFIGDGYVYGVDGGDAFMDIYLSSNSYSIKWFWCFAITVLGHNTRYLVYAW